MSILAFALPAGGAILTIRNLERLQELTPRDARRLLYLTAAVFAIGLAGLEVVAPKDRNGHLAAVDSGALFILSAGIAIVSYLAQRASFRTWQSSHPAERAGSPLEAIGLTLVYSLLTALITLPLVLIAAQLSGASLALVPP